MKNFLAKSREETASEFTPSKMRAYVPRVPCCVVC